MLELRSTKEISKDIDGAVRMLGVLSTSLSWPPFAVFNEVPSDSLQLHAPPSSKFLPQFTLKTEARTSLWSYYTSSQSLHLSLDACSAPLVRRFLILTSVPCSCEPSSLPGSVNGSENSIRQES